jgi:uncharacterized membrane protein
MQHSLFSRAQQSLSGNWLTAIATSIIYGILSSIAGITYIGWLVVGHLMVGMSIWSLNVARGREFKIEDLFGGFKEFVAPLVINILVGIAVFIGLLFLIVPGIVIGLGLSMSYFIVGDNPKIDGVEAMKQSWAMMRGNKTRLFGLYLQFFLLGLLCILTLGIGFFFLIPYTQIVLAHFYLSIKSDQSDAFDAKYVVS